MHTLGEAGQLLVGDIAFLHDPACAVLCCVLCGPAGLKAALAGTCFCSDDDSLVLEDEGARMVLRSECDALSLDALVTGEVFLCGGGRGGVFVALGRLWLGDACF